MLLSIAALFGPAANPDASAAAVSFNLCWASTPLAALGYPDPCWWSADQTLASPNATELLRADLPLGATWFVRIRGDPLGLLAGGVYTVVAPAGPSGQAPQLVALPVAPAWGVCSSSAPPAPSTALLQSASAVSEKKKPSVLRSPPAPPAPTAPTAPSGNRLPPVPMSSNVLLLTGSSAVPLPLAGKYTADASTTGSPTGSAVSLSLYQPYLAFDGLLSTSDPNYWCSAAVYSWSSSTTTTTTSTSTEYYPPMGEWLQLSLPTAVMLTGYTLNVPGDSSWTNGPTSWALFGSNDQTNWRQLDTQSNVPIRQGKSVTVTPPFSGAGVSDPYSSFRFVTTQIYNAQAVCIAELLLFGTVPLLPPKLLPPAAPPSPRALTPELSPRPPNQVRPCSHRRVCIEPQRAREWRSASWVG